MLMRVLRAPRSLWRLGQNHVAAWRKRREPKGLILLYHRVAALESDPQLLAVTPENFDRHIALLKTLGTPMHLSDMIAAAAAGRLPRRAIAVTFDDGYADNLYYAKPILQRHAVPATVFIATDFIERQREYWWDVIERAILAPTPLPDPLILPFPEGPRQWPASGDFLPAPGWSVLSSDDPSPRHSLYRALMTAINPLSRDQRDKVLSALVTAAQIPEEARDSHRPLTRAEVVTLAEGNVVTIGAHSHHHPRLSGLSAAEQETEIDTGRQRLTAWLGQDIDTFAFPYGNLDAYSGETVSLIKRKGFVLSCSNYPGLVRGDTDRYQLPRLLVRNITPQALQNLIIESFDHLEPGLRA
ncbi:MAG: polysaccharide deacetylase family protein [Ferrovibrio sp.]|uniref:polysaccharide deacetylase family protein n=1 Tax=Ferrovibrio sp. TaxID=1917215 RepID=UPI00391A686D